MLSCMRWRRTKRLGEIEPLPPARTQVELVIQSPPAEDWAADSLSAINGTTQTPRSTTAVDLRLPLELWRRVFEYARTEHRHTLAQLLHLHPALLSTAESVLYGAITLVTDTSVVKLSESISSYPRLAKLVRELHVLAPIAANHTALELACLLRFLPELEYLKLGIAGVWRPEPWWDFAKCVDILAVRFAHLRGFATAGPPLPNIERGVPHFIRGHSSTLHELDLSNARAPTTKASAEPYKRMFLPELRVLACHPRMIWEKLQVTGKLKCICLTESRIDYLFHLSAVVGTHLVSLCLRSAIWVDNPQEPGWTVADVAEHFPRLKYLQVDREVQAATSPAGIGIYPINWQSDPPPEPARRKTQRFTVVWTHQSWGPFDISLGWWTNLTDEWAARFLVNWSAYLERVVYRYADGAFGAVYWNEEGQVVCVEDWDMDEDESWKLVT